MLELLNEKWGFVYNWTKFVTRIRPGYDLPWLIDHRFTVIRSFLSSLTSEPFFISPWFRRSVVVQWSGPEPVAGWRFWTCCQFLKFTVCLPACLIYKWRLYSPHFHILHVLFFLFFFSIVSPTCFILSVWPAGGLWRSRAVFFFLFVTAL